MSNILKSFYKFISPQYQKVYLEYKVDNSPRYGYGNPPHYGILHILQKNEKIYREYAEKLVDLKDYASTIRDSSVEKDENQPTWNNGFLPGLDILSIALMLRHFHPKYYIEVGSGNSTKVARKAITTFHLNTEITSIDPFPRANIDHLADEVMRVPFEQLKDFSAITEKLGTGDILFIDNSHRVLPNSDATVFFLEILPKLKSGVIVMIHDIHFPYDYPQEMCDRFYSEQYVLAAVLLANPEKFKPIFPSYYIAMTEEISNIYTSVWPEFPVKPIEKHGTTFWFQIE